MQIQFRKNRFEDGWTLVETIIVCAIILTLTGIVGVSGMHYVGKAKRLAAASEIAALSLALDGYYLDCGNYPTSDQGLSALWTKPDSLTNSEAWTGPYLAKKDFKDPWGNPYLYENPGPENLPFILTSLGADGTEGGDKNNADILSWKDSEDNDTE